MPPSLAQPISIPGFADPVSALTHLLGAVVFLAMGVRLVRRGHRNQAVTGRAGGWHTTSLAVFAFSCVFLLSMSGVFHLLARGQGRDVLQRLDHAAIFVLIAGTFTPIHAILFRGVLRWGILGLVWLGAVLGIVFKTVYFEGFPEWLSVGLYLGLGWIGGISMLVVWRTHGLGFGWRMIAAGVSYTVGAVVDYARWPTLIEGVLGPHEIFHLFVLLGAMFFWRFVERVESERGAMPVRVRRERRAVRDAA
ncbi:MAG: hemolysin III family protein [Phycisphaerales bacterium JB040]